jgi:3-oxoacyl-[acyl-carrier protein] reductase
MTQLFGPTTGPPSSVLDERDGSAGGYEPGAVAVVTGAAGQIGSAICEALVAVGATVVGVERVGQAPPGTLTLRADVADPHALTDVAAQVGGRFGRVDWLVHSAALTGRGGLPPGAERLSTVPPAVWNEILRVNLTAGLLCTQAFLPLLRRSRTAHIFLIGSVQGMVPTLGAGCYAASKAALAGLMRQLAAELAEEGIRVNMLSPGPIADEAEIQALVGETPTPLRRYGTPQEVGAAVATLLGAPFEYMTGTEIPLDGGEHLRPRGQPRHDPASWAQPSGAAST